MLDEQWIVNKNVLCIEKKHNPSRADLTDALFRNFAFRNLKHLNVANPTHFPIGLTSNTISVTCFSLCEYFGYCKQSNWAKCQNKLLSQYNKAANFRLDADFRKVLIEGYLNKFPVFVIGTRSANIQTIGEIQTSIMEQIASYLGNLPNLILSTITAEGGARNRTPSRSGLRHTSNLKSTRLNMSGGKHG